MNITPPQYRFCPFCGNRLTSILEENKTRLRCEPCRWTYYPRAAASATAIVRKHGKVLLVKRLREPFKGTWMFPSGFVDYGEHPEETVGRELQEETGLTMTAARLLGVCLSPDDPRALGHFVFFYETDVVEGQIRTDPHENEEIRWFDLSNLPEVKWELHRRFLHDVKNKQPLQ